MAAHERPEYSQQNYQDAKGRINVFCDNEIKKDSELQLTDQQARDLIRKAEMHSQQNYQSAVVHSTCGDMSGRDLRSPPHAAFNIPPMMQQPARTESSSVYVASPADTSTDKVEVDNSPSTSGQSAPTPDMYSTLDPINKAIESQSENYKRLTQSDKTHVCQTCFKTFRNKPQLTQHELVHNNLRKHTCSYCDKAFKQLSHLNQHIRVHTGERPYKCTMDGCGRSFAQLSNLNHHKKNHEEHIKRDEARQYRCDVCDRSYATNQSLHTHIQKLHTNLKAAEGTVSCPIVSPPPVKKTKKSKNATAAVSSASSLSDPYAIDGMDDTDLPTQVKLKSRYQPGLQVRMDTPPTEKNARPLSRTILPPTMSFHQSPLELRAPHVQDSFIASLSDNNPLHQTHYPPHLFAHNTSIISHGQGSESPHNGKPNSEDHQRELMQASLQNNSDKGYVSSKPSQRQPSYSPSIQNMANIQNQERRLMAPHSPDSRQLSDNPSHNPSHIAHHFPKLPTSTRPESHHVFNPAFSTADSSVRQPPYRPNQY